MPADLDVFHGATNFGTLGKNLIFAPDPIVPPLRADTIIGVDPPIAPFADVAGPMLAHACMQADTSAIDAGSNPQELPFDQLACHFG